MRTTFRQYIQNTGCLGPLASESVLGAAVELGSASVSWCLCEMRLQEVGLEQSSRAHTWFHRWHTLPLKLIAHQHSGLFSPTGLGTNEGSTFISMPSPTSCQGFSKSSQTLGKEVWWYQNYLFLCLLCSISSIISLDIQDTIQGHGISESFVLKYLGQQVHQEWAAPKVGVKKNHLAHSPLL